MAETAGDHDALAGPPRGRHSGADGLEEVAEKLLCTQQWFRHYAELKPSLRQFSDGAVLLDKALSHVERLGPWSRLFKAESDVVPMVEASFEELRRLRVASGVYQERLQQLALTAARELGEGKCGESAASAEDLTQGLGAVRWRSHAGAAGLGSTTTGGTAAAHGGTSEAPVAEWTAASTSSSPLEAISTSSSFKSGNAGTVPAATSQAPVAEQTAARSTASPLEASWASNASTSARAGAAARASEQTVSSTSVSPFEAFRRRVASTTGSGGTIASGTSEARAAGWSTESTTTSPPEVSTSSGFGGSTSEAPGARPSSSSTTPSLHEEAPGAGRGAASTASPPAEIHVTSGGSTTASASSAANGTAAAPLAERTATSTSLSPLEAFGTSAGPMPATAGAVAGGATQAPSAEWTAAGTTAPPFEALGASRGAANRTSEAPVAEQTATSMPSSPLEAFGTGGDSVSISAGAGTGGTSRAAGSATSKDTAAGQAVASTLAPPLGAFGKSAHSTAGSGATAAGGTPEAPGAGWGTANTTLSPLELFGTSMGSTSSSGAAGTTPSPLEALMTSVGSTSSSGAAAGGGTSEAPGAGPNAASTTPSLHEEEADTTPSSLETSTTSVSTTPGSGGAAAGGGTSEALGAGPSTASTTSSLHEEEASTTSVGATPSSGGAAAGGGTSAAPGTGPSAASTTSSLREEEEVAGAGATTSPAPAASGPPSQLRRNASIRAPTPRVEQALPLPGGGTVRVTSATGAKVNVGTGTRDNQLRANQSQQRQLLDPCGSLSLNLSVSVKVNRRSGNSSTNVSLRMRPGPAGHGCACNGSAGGNGGAKTLGGAAGGEELGAQAPGPSAEPARADGGAAGGATRAPGASVNTTSPLEALRPSGSSAPAGGGSAANGTSEAPAAERTSTSWAPPEVFRTGGGSVPAGAGTVAGGAEWTTTSTSSPPLEAATTRGRPAGAIGVNATPSSGKNGASTTPAAGEGAAATTASSSAPGFEGSNAAVFPHATWTFPTSRPREEEEEEEEEKEGRPATTTAAVSSSTSSRARGPQVPIMPDLAAADASAPAHAARRRRAEARGHAAWEERAAANASTSTRATWRHGAEVHKHAVQEKAAHGHHEAGVHKHAEKGIARWYYEDAHIPLPPVKSRYCTDERVRSPWRMSARDDFDMQVGWLSLLVVMVGTYVLFMALRACMHGPKALEEQDGAEPRLEASLGCAAFLHGAFWGPGALNACLDVLVVALGLANFALFGLATEALLPGASPDLAWVPRVFEYLELGSLSLVALLLVGRALGAQAHPSWQRFGCGAVWRYLLLDIYANIEEVALILSLLSYMRCWLVHSNFVWLCGIRSIEMLARRKMGIHFRGLWAEFEKEKRMLFSMFAMGFVLWLLISGLHFVLNHDNELAQWKYAVLDGQPWQRMYSVPSAMFFVLLNLCKKNPLAHVYVDFDQRLLLCLVNTFGVPLFALPTATFGSMIMRVTMAEDDGEEDEEEEEEDDEEEVLPWYLEGDTYTAVSCGLGFGSVCAYFLSTTQGVRLLHVPLYVGPWALAHIDGLVGLAFAAEWLARLGRGGTGYLLSWWSALDFFSAWPGVLHLLLLACHGRMDGSAGRWLCALCVVRIFKTERFTGSFTDMHTVFVRFRPVLVTTSIVSLFTWMLVATLLYHTEHLNPDPRMRNTYGSVARAFWTEGINVFGEWVVCDYTVVGKAVCALVAIFSVSICVVPLTVLSGGYFAELSEDYEDTSERSGECQQRKRKWQLECRPEAPCVRQAVFDTFYAHLLPASGTRYPLGYRIIRTLSTFFTLAVTAVTVFGTLQALDYHVRFRTAWQSAIYGAFYCMDAASIPFFAFTFTLRTYALGWRHPLSLLGAAELLSLAGVALSLAPWRDSVLHHREHSEAELALLPWFKWLLHVFDAEHHLVLVEGLVIQMRLLRLFSIESYFGTLVAVRDVVSVHARPLLRSLLTLVSVWYVHATLLYLFESDDGQMDLQRPQAHRYGDVLSSLQYSLVHLTGDFPITAYKLPAKAVLLAGIAIGMCAFATFAGVFSSGLVNYLMREREAELMAAAEKRMRAATQASLKMQRRFRQMQAKKAAAAQRRKALAEGEEAVAELVAKLRAIAPPDRSGAGEDEDEQQDEPDSGDEWPQASRPASQAPGILDRCRDLRERSARIQQHMRAILDQRTRAGKIIMSVVQAALVINVANTLASTVPEVYVHQGADSVLRFVEVACDVVFLAEYLFRLVAGGPTGSPFAPMRLFDLFCLAPGIVEFYYAWVGQKWQRAHTGSERYLELVMLVRVARVLDFPCFRREVVTVCRALHSAVGVLTVPAFLSLHVWVTTASAFVWLEKLYEGPAQGQMTSIPAAMYWTSSFLVGEWALIDFSPGAGSRLCILCCLFGMMIFALPSGIIIESVQSALMLELVENQRLDKLDELPEEGLARMGYAPPQGEQQKKAASKGPAQALQRRLRTAVAAAKRFYEPPATARP